MEYSNKVTNLYKNLDASQQAKLAFHYAAEHNEIEFERIESVVRWKDFHCQEWDYVDSLRKINDFYMLWSVTHLQMRWRLSSLLVRRLAALCRSKKHEGKERIADWNKMDDLLDTHREQERELLALDAAMESVCNAKGIDPADVRKSAELNEFKASRKDIKPNIEAWNYYQSVFEKIFETGADSEPQ